MATIERDVSLLQRRRVAPIYIVYGSAVRIRLNIIDYTIPENATVEFFAQCGSGTVYRCGGTASGNSAAFTPPEGFFQQGDNALQLEINGRLIPLSLDVKCEERISGVGSEETPEQVRPLVLQAQEAAKEASLAASSSSVSASAAAESASAAAKSETAACNAATAAGQSANAAAGSASAALESQNAAAGSAQEALTSKNAAASSADSAAGSASAAAGSASAAAVSAGAAAGSAQEAKEALGKNTSIAVRTPYIGENGNWFVWSSAADGYVDSGVKAQGPQGIPGTGNVSSVCGVIPGDDGNVVLTAENVGARPDSWMPTAANVGALPLSGGNMTGGINMVGNPISGLNPPTGETHAANKGYVDASVRKAAPRNLLDNSDFTNFVAQAGISGNHGTITYAADRWILDSGTVSYTEGTGLTLNGTIRQKLEFPPTGETSAFVGMESGAASISYADGAVTITSNGGVLKWAALYGGVYSADTMPDYQPKGYGAELAECQRYYKLIYNACFIISQNFQKPYRGNSIYFGDMRGNVIPTPKLIPREDGAVGFVQGVMFITAGTTDVQWESNGSNTICVNTSNESWAGKQVTLYCIALSADL